MTEPTPKPPIEPQWRTRYGPMQLRDLLGITEWQHLRCTDTGVIPPPDAAAGKWSGTTARKMYALRAAIRAHAGAIPDLGAFNAAGILTDRLGFEVHTHAVYELAHQGLILCVGEFKGNPLYCGRTLETWSDWRSVERANIEGERLTADATAEYLQVRRSDVDHLVRLGWLTPIAWGRGPYTAKKYTPDVPLYRAGDVIAIADNQDIDWHAVRATPKGKRSLLAALPDRNGGQP